MASAFATEPIRRRKLYEEIVARLEATIVAGKLSPGDQLPSERELMDAYGVGRTSVREALFALERRGLVALSSGERARVTQPSPETLVGELAGAARHLLSQPDGVRHFQGARMLFETAIVRHAARHRTEDDIAQLREALAANRAAIGRPADFAATDIAFHDVLARIPRNPIFTALHAAMSAWLFEQRTISGRASPSNRAACRAHESIFRAVQARDPEAADAAMRVHLDEVERFYWLARKVRFPTTS